MSESRWRVGTSALTSVHKQELREALGVVDPDWPNVTNKPEAYPPAAHTHQWQEIQGKPETYPSSSHSHPWSAITDKPATYAPSAHTHPWTEVTGKPSTYPPAAHTHASADISGAVTVRKSGGVVEGARMWIGTTAANSSGVWTIDYSDAGFTEVYGVFPSAVSKGTALADRLIASNSVTEPTLTTASGHLMSASAAGLLVAVTLTESAGTVKVLVVGR